MISAIIPINSVTDISEGVLEKNKKIRLLSSDVWKKYDWNSFRAFCHSHPRYGIPTTELVQFLREKINGRHAIEIGAGAGDLGYHLRIGMTDSRQQEIPEIRRHYELMQQPVIQYPDDVEKLEALDAVRRYRPEVVIGSWITTYAPHEMPYGSNPYGIRELDILGSVSTFIIIGNTDIHHDKPIMNIEHEEYGFDWLISRGKNQSNNRIWIWNRKT
jgi:hypothetical protein